MTIILENRDAIVTRFKELGYSYVAMDLEGFRSGSMNEVLGKKQAPAAPTDGLLQIEDVE